MNVSLKKIKMLTCADVEITPASVVSCKEGREGTCTLFSINTSFISPRVNPAANRIAGDEYLWNTHCLHDVICSDIITMGNPRNVTKV